MDEDRITITTWPAALKEKLAIKYVGGGPFWNELLAAYPDRLRPVRRSKVRGDSIFRRQTIDDVLMLAEADQSLVHEPEKPSRPPARDKISA